MNEIQISARSCDVMRGNNALVLRRETRARDADADALRERACGRGGRAAVDVSTRARVRDDGTRAGRADGGRGGRRRGGAARSLIPKG